MSVNGITGTSQATDLYSTYNKSTSKKDTTSDTAKTSESKSGVVYEPSEKSGNINHAEVVAMMKEDAEKRSQQLQDIVKQLISKQGNAYGQATDMWQFLASGNYTVDAATKAQAQEDVSEDGYWGVDKTSSRIVDFAKALCGNDPSKLEEMRDAFEKGFKEATNSWGKDLPGISNDTYNAVMEKFDKWAEEVGTTTD